MVYIIILCIKAENGKHMDFLYSEDQRFLAKYHAFVNELTKYSWKTEDETHTYTLFNQSLSEN